MAHHINLLGLRPHYGRVAVIDVHGFYGRTIGQGTYKIIFVFLN